MIDKHLLIYMRNKIDITDNNSQNLQFIRNNRRSKASANEANNTQPDHVIISVY